MTRRTIIKSLIDEQLATANSPLRAEEGTRDRVLAGPVRTMSLTLDRIEEESRALQEALTTGASVVELDPNLITGSTPSPTPSTPCAASSSITCTFRR